MLIHVIKYRYVTNFGVYPCGISFKTFRIKSGMSLDYTRKLFSSVIRRRCGQLISRLSVKLTLRNLIPLQLVINAASSFPNSFILSCFH